MTSLIRPMLLRSSAIARNYDTTTTIRNAKKCVGALSPKMMRNQRRFQACDGKPVFLKGGSFDNILYRLTVALALIGLVGNFHLYFGYLWAPYTREVEEEEEDEDQKPKEKK